VLFPLSSSPLPRRGKLVRTFIGAIFCVHNQPLVAIAGTAPPCSRGATRRIIVLSSILRAASRETSNRDSKHAATGLPPFSRANGAPRNPWIYLPLSPFHQRVSSRGGWRRVSAHFFSRVHRTRYDVARISGMLPEIRGGGIGKLRSLRVTD